MPFSSQLSSFRQHRVARLAKDVTDVKTQITKILTQRKLGPELFISDYELRVIWGSSRLRNLVSQFCSDKAVDFVCQKFLKVITILVYIHWDGWSEFETLFLYHTDSDRQNDRLDAHLPFADCAFLDTFCYNFRTDQFIFLPICFEQGQSQEVSKDRRLPFLQLSSIDRQGAFGEVTQCEIARGQFLYGGEPRRLNEKVR